MFKDGSIDVLVMENIFYDRQVSRIYDLKGSERSRYGGGAAGWGGAAGRGGGEQRVCLCVCFYIRSRGCALS